MKKGNVLAVLLATVGIMLFGTLAVSADAHAGIQSASGKSNVPTAIAENESGAVTSAKASVGKTRKAKASVNAVADSGLYQVKIAGDICPSAGSRAMDLINQYRKANGKGRIVQDNAHERMAITRAGEISVYYNAMRPSGRPGSDCIIGFYDEDKGENIDSWFNKLDTINPKLREALLEDQWKSGWVGVFRSEAGYCYVAVDLYPTATQGSTDPKDPEYSEGEYTLTVHVMDKCLNVKGLLCDKNANLDKGGHLLLRSDELQSGSGRDDGCESVLLSDHQVFQHQGDFCHPGWYLEGKIPGRRESNRQAGGRFRTVHVQDAGGSAEQGDRREADRKEESHEGCVEEDGGSIWIQGVPGNFQEGKVHMRQDRIFKNNFLHQQEAEEEQEILL